MAATKSLSQASLGSRRGPRLTRSLELTKLSASTSADRHRAVHFVERDVQQVDSVCTLGCAPVSSFVLLRRGNTSEETCALPPPDACEHGARAREHTAAARLVSDVQQNEADQAGCFVSSRSRNAQGIQLHEGCS